MQALILAAGEGKRIKPIVTSKPLIPFGGKTLLEWIVSGCQVLKPTQIVIVVNPKDKASIAKLFPKAKIVVQTKPNGMAGAILAARATRSVLVGPTVVINGDDLISEKTLLEFRQQIESKPKAINLTAKKQAVFYTGGYMEINNNRVTAVIEKPSDDEKPSDLINLVLHYFPDIKELTKNLVESNKDDNQYEIGLNLLLKSSPAELLVTHQPFAQLKYPWQILDMTQIILNHELKSQIHPSAQIHKTSVIEGPVQIETGVKIMPYAVIKGPVYLGKKVIIGDHTLVRNSLIEAGSVVGYKSEIVRSYVGPNNNFHANYVGDSVIEADSNLGSGATLANLRFDKKEIIPGRNKLGAIMAQGSQLGVNASVMPGVSLGAKAIVGSGLVLAKSLEAGEFKKN